jgi:hypothetical protein
MAGGAVSMPIMGVHVVRGIVGFVFSFCVNWIYEAGLESSSKQATLGKMALALKVTDLPGQRISFAGYRTALCQNYFWNDTSHRLHHGGIYPAQASFTRHDCRNFGHSHSVNIPCAWC